MRWPPVVLLTTSLMFVAACDTNKAPLNPDFGESVNRNMMAHIIKRRVPSPNAPLPDMQGERAFHAIDSYNRGDTKSLQEESTTSKPGKGGGHQ